MPINVLILCTANSARSILGEAILNRLGGARVRGYSAGSKPRGEPNPVALSLLAEEGHEVSTLRSKSWDAFAEDGAPSMDVVITVCDSAAGEACPIWPGAPVSGHWGIPDPAGAGATVNEERAAFREAYDRLETRIRAFLALPLETMSHSELKSALNRIGAESDGATELAQAIAS